MSLLRLCRGRFALICLSAGAVVWGAAPASAIVINSDVTGPGDTVYGVFVMGTAPSSGEVTPPGGGPNTNLNNSPGGEQAPNAIDDSLTTKYLNFAGTTSNINNGDFTGIIVTPSAARTEGPTILNGFRMAAANDATSRDPITIRIEGTNDPIPVGAGPFEIITANWSPIYSGPSGLEADPGRNTYGPLVPFVPTTPTGFNSYRVLVTSVRTNPQTCCQQFGEIELIGSTIPEPASLGVLGLAAIGMLARRRRA